MSKKYIFRKIKEDEVTEMFQMILERMKWMNEKGIKQWNVTNYDEVYPLSYYEKAQQDGEVFVLYNTETNHISAAAVLKNQDERWHDDKKAIYLHNFVSRVKEQGTGTLFIEYAQNYAKSIGIDYFRLDSAKDNKSLANYYESQGFLPKGTCVDGLYQGILREKEL